MIDGVAPTISVDINDGSDDFINAAEQFSVSISGTTTGVEDNQNVSIDITDGNNTINTSTTTTSNSYSVTNLDLSSLADGILTITADVRRLSRKCSKPSLSIHRQRYGCSDMISAETSTGSSRVLPNLRRNTCLDHSSGVCLYCHRRRLQKRRHSCYNLRLQS